MLGHFAPFRTERGLGELIFYKHLVPNGTKHPTGPFRTSSGNAVKSDWRRGLVFWIIKRRLHDARANAMTNCFDCGLDLDLRARFAEFSVDGSQRDQFLQHR